ncbi:histone H3.v1 [Biomphalaria glabrata]|nr:histone H3.v1-like [Biomphalaria glabrata]
MSTHRGLVNSASVQESMDTGGQDGGESDEKKVELTLERKKTVLQAVHHDNLHLPKVTLEVATPVPDAIKDVEFVDHNDDDNDVSDEDEEDSLSEDDPDDDKDALEEDKPESKGENEPDDEERTEMTSAEKRDMYEAVKSGDIDWLEDCLDKRNSDINMTWFKENMLMTAIRNEQEEMAEFLLDNGVDHSYTASVVNLKDTPKGKILERYDVTCRQLAYDHGMLGIVEIIDILQGNLFPFIRPNPRIPRLRRPKPPTPSCSEGSGSSSEDADVSSVAAEGADEDETEIRKHRKRRRRRKKSGVKGEDVNVVIDSNEDAAAANVSEYNVEHSTSNESAKKCDEKPSNIFKETLGLKQPSSSVSSKETGYLISPKGSSAVVNKETYSVTFKEEQPEIKVRLVKPRTGSPSTKSSMGVSRARNNVRRVSAFGGNSSIEEHPMKWRKISTVGSYSRESKNWHIEHIPGQEYVEIIDLRPTSALSSTSFLPSSTPLYLSMSSHRNSFASVTSDQTIRRTSEEVFPLKVKPEKPLPSYMKSTASSLTKKRLNPSFVNSYGALDFR